MGRRRCFGTTTATSSPRDLIYDPHPPTREPDTSQPVVIVEGEKAADALHARGVSVLGTVCGAGTVPSTDVLRHYINKRMAYLWPDRDHEGQVHMTKIAERLGGDVQMVDLGRLDDLPNEKGADAADWNLAQNADAWAAIKEASSVVTPPDLDALPEAVHDALDALAGATTKTGERLLRTLKQTIPQDADALFCRRIQTEATAQLKAANIPTPATWVRDAALKPPKTTEKDDTPTGVGRPVKFDDPTPWDEPVDGAALLAELVSIIERFMVLPPGAAVAVAGWIVFAWSHDGLLYATAADDRESRQRVRQDDVACAARRPRAASPARLEHDGGHTLSRVGELEPDLPARRGRSVARDRSCPHGRPQCGAPPRRSRDALCRRQQ